jgi:hypothetical protein
MKVCCFPNTTTVSHNVILPVQWDYVSYLRIKPTHTHIQRTQQYSLLYLPSCFGGHPLSSGSIYTNIFEHYIASYIYSSRIRCIIVTSAAIFIGCKIQQSIVCVVTVYCATLWVLLQIIIIIILLLFILVTCHEGRGGSRRVAVLCSKLGARWGWVVNATLRPLQPRERPGNRCTGGRVDPRARLDGCGKSRSHRDSIPGPSRP